MGILRKKGGDVYAKRLSTRSKTLPLDDISAMIGTLRSELDEPSNLPSAFEDLVTQSARAKLAYDNGEMTKAQYAMVLRGLRLVAPDGTEWTTGASSGTWYCRPVGGAWVRATPPVEEGVKKTPAPARVLPPREVVIPVSPAGVKSGESYKPGTVQGGFTDVKQSPSAENPVVWESAEIIDEHGVWSPTWSAPERSKPASEDELLDQILKAAENMVSQSVSGTPKSKEADAVVKPETESAPSLDFDPFGQIPEDPKKEVGGGWAAWGMSPDDGN